MIAPFPDHCDLLPFYNSIAMFYFCILSVLSWTKSVPRSNIHELVDSHKRNISASVSRVSAQRSGGTGFDPGPRHTKVVYIGTSCSPLGTRIFGVGLGLVAPVSV